MNILQIVGYAGLVFVGLALLVGGTAFVIHAIETIRGEWHD